MKKILVANGWVVTFIAAALLLGMHTFSMATIQVDNVSLVLLVILLISPFVSEINRIKIGDFEAEIDPREVQKIKDEVSAKIGTGENYKHQHASTELQDAMEHIKALVLTDHVLALAKLRIELEKILRKISCITIDEKFKNVHLGKLLYELDYRDILSSDTLGPLKEVLYLCKRAVHGQEVKIDDARVIVECGISLLMHLNNIRNDYLAEPEKMEEITNEEVDSLKNAKYEVTTVVPLGEKPFKNIRIISQQGLSEILEEYNGHTEFIVEVKPVDDSTTGE